MRIAVLLASALLALSLPVPGLAQEATPTEAAPKPVRRFTLGVATQEYFVAFGAQLVSVGALVGATVLVATKVDEDTGADPRPSGHVYAAAIVAAPPLAPVASACLLALFEDRPGFKLRSGLRAWLVGMGATFLAEMIGGIAVYAAYSQHDRLPGRTGVIVGSIAMVLLPSLLEVVAFEGGRSTQEPQSVSLVPFLTEGGGGVGLAGAF